MTTKQFHSSQHSRSRWVFALRLEKYLPVRIFNCKNAVRLTKSCKPKIQSYCTQNLTAKTDGIGCVFSLLPVSGRWCLMFRDRPTGRSACRPANFRGRGRAGRQILPNFQAETAGIQGRPVGRPRPGPARPGRAHVWVNFVLQLPRHNTQTPSSWHETDLTEIHTLIIS